MILACSIFLPILLCRALLTCARPLRIRQSLLKPYFSWRDCAPMHAHVHTQTPRLDRRKTLGHSVLPVIVFLFRLSF